MATNSAVNPLVTPGGDYATNDPVIAAKIKEMQAAADPSQFSNPSVSAPTAPAAPTLSPEDAANAAKFSTPLPPKDPASLSGARANPLYIGPTSFSNIQQNFTPYQIEQATERDANGNIFWKKGVDINKIAKSAPIAPFTAPNTVPQPSTSSLPNTPSVPNVDTSGSGTASFGGFAAAQSQAAQTYLTGIQKTMDDLLAYKQSLEQQQKEQAQASVDKYKKGLEDLSNNNSTQIALERARNLFHVEDTINTLGVINRKIADATNALNQGILYEKDQPVRMALLTGRSAALQRQGIATIGALQSSAEALKGNLDLARTYANDTIDALKQDNDNRRSALNTLLNLSHDDLVRLSDDEKKTVEDRMKLLKDEDDRLENNRKQLTDLATNYPSAFAKGGVTFADSPQQALAKMLPQLSQQEAEKYKLDLESKKLNMQKQKADIANTNSQISKRASSGGSGSSTGVLSTLSPDLQAIFDAGFREGKTLDQIVADVGGPTQFSTKQWNQLQDYWSSVAKTPAQKTVSASDLANNYGIDPSKNPEYIGITEQQLKDKLVAEKNKPAPEEAKKWYEFWK